MSLSIPHPLSLSPYEGEREEILEREQSPLFYLYSPRKRNTEGESKRGFALLF